MASTKQPTKGKPEEAAATKSVIAIKDGFYQSYRVAGEQFEVPADLLATWFIDATPVEKSEASDLV